MKRGVCRPHPCPDGTIPHWADVLGRSLNRRIDDIKELQGVGGSKWRKTTAKKAGWRSLREDYVRGLKLTNELHNVYS